jgi:hypothetical protein
MGHASGPVRIHGSRLERRRALTPQNGPGLERRDLTIRPERDAVAAFFGIHPAHIAALARGVVAVMAYRVQGDRRHWAESAQALDLVHRSGAPPHQAA